MNKVHFRVLLNIENMLNTSMWFYNLQHMFKSDVSSYDNKRSDFTS